MTDYDELVQELKGLFAAGKTAVELYVDEEGVQHAREPDVESQSNLVYGRPLEETQSTDLAKETEVIRNARQCGKGPAMEPAAILAAASVLSQPSQLAQQRLSDDSQSAFLKAMRILQQAKKPLKWNFIKQSLGTWGPQAHANAFNLLTKSESIKKTQKKGKIYLEWVGE